MIDRLEMEQFRGIERLVLTDLTRVNVLVGANNVGKTSVLEAVFLLEQLGVTEAIQGLMERRGYSADTPRNSAELLLRQAAPSPSVLRGTGRGKAWSVELVKKGATVDATVTGLASDGTSLSRHWAAESAYGDEARIGRPPAVFFDFPRVRDDLVAERIGALSVKRRKQGLVDALQLIDSRVVGVDQYKLPGTRAVEAWVDLGLPQLLRLTQAGHGLRYAAALFTELEQVKDTILLVDEVEVGLHHHALEAVWQAMNAQSKANGLQLFVTTHSAECLRAAHAAMAAEPEDLAVFRLERTAEGELVAFRLGAEEREAAFHYGSEVR